MKWMLYPSSTLLPLEHSPRTSIHDWYHNRIYPILGQKERPNECETHVGDLIFIPEGWWQAYLVDSEREGAGEGGQHGSSSGPVLLAETRWLHMTTKTEILREKANRQKKDKDYLAAMSTLIELVTHTERDDLEALYLLGVMMSTRKVQSSVGKVLSLSQEMELKREAMLKMENRTCDVLHSLGRTMLRIKDFSKARKLSRECVGICDRFFKCYELLSRAVIGVRGEKTSVAEQALEMSREYKRTAKITIGFDGGSTIVP